MESWGESDGEGRGRDGERKGSSNFLFMLILLSSVGVCMLLTYMKNKLHKQKELRSQANIKYYRLKQHSKYAFQSAEGTKLGPAAGEILECAFGSILVLPAFPACSSLSTWTLLQQMSCTFRQMPPATRNQVRCRSVGVSSGGGYR